jgi:hypothetical protein
MWKMSALTNVPTVERIAAWPPRFDGDEKTRSPSSSRHPRLRPALQQVNTDGVAATAHVNAAGAERDDALRRR